MEKSAFQFSTPVITDMIFRANNESDAKSQTPKEVPTHINVHEKRSETEKSAVVALDLKVGGVGDDFPFYIRAVMQAKFFWDEIEESMVNTLLARNAPSLLLSYLRPYIASITSASPIHALQIPFMDFTRNANDKDEK